MLVTHGSKRVNGEEGSRWATCFLGNISTCSAFLSINIYQSTWIDKTGTPKNRCLEEN